jgi:hypothetical protein
LSARKNGEPPNIDNLAVTGESINRLALRVGLGSSIFPTGGWAFPTFTIIVLSLRLAEHLRTRLEFDSLVSLSPLEAVGNQEHKKNKSHLC